MSLDESQEEDCTVYIEELKSDNAGLKLNAASKLTNIAAVLGSFTIDSGINRIRDQLIPYIIEIIEQMDNENDFLVKIAEGLLDLKQFCNNTKELSILIPPLKILASLDQPIVRDQAINSLKNLPVGKSPDFYEKKYVELIRTLSDKANPFSPKVTAAYLIASTYTNVSQQNQAELREIYRKLALEEDSPLVRRAVAENIESFSKVVSKTIVKNLFLDIWQRFIVDPIDIIRIKALETAGLIARAFKKEENSEHFFKWIKQVDVEKKSWRIRYALIECLAVMLDFLDKDIIKKDVTEIWEQLLKDNEVEVRAFALIKSPLLTQKLSPQQNFTTFFQYFEKASKENVKEAPPTVKLALVEAIVPYFKSIGAQKIAEPSCLALINGLFKDQNQAVRVSFVQKLPALQEAMGRELTASNLLPLLESCLTDKKWRFKLAFAENIVALFKAIGIQNNREFMEKAFNTFFKDHSSAVRQQTVKSLIEMKQLLGAAHIELVTKYINSLLNDVNSIYRVTSCQLVAATVALSKSELNESFKLLFPKMSTEKVPNIFIAFFNTYSKTKHLLTSQTKKQFQQTLTKITLICQDQDVQYYASIADE